MANIHNVSCQTIATDPVTSDVFLFLHHCGRQWQTWEHLKYVVHHLCFQMSSLPALQCQMHSLSKSNNNVGSVCKNVTIIHRGDHHNFRAQTFFSQQSASVPKHWGWVSEHRQGPSLLYRDYTTIKIRLDDIFLSFSVSPSLLSHTHLPPSLSVCNMIVKNVV